MLRTSSSPHLCCLLVPILTCFAVVHFFWLPTYKHATCTCRRLVQYYTVLSSASSYTESHNSSVHAARSSAFRATRKYDRDPTREVVRRSTFAHTTTKESLVWRWNITRVEVKVRMHDITTSEKRPETANRPALRLLFRIARE